MKCQNEKSNYVYDEDRMIELLKGGRVVTVPTETVEGYAVRLDDERAIRELMSIKERGFDSGKVFTLVPESKQAICKYALISLLAKDLIEKYIPGELTVILPKNPDFKHFYYDHFDTVGIRIPAYPLFERVSDEVGAVILTSANPRGGVPKTTTGHLPSTIVDCTSDELMIIRQGNLEIKI